MVHCLPSRGGADVGRLEGKEWKGQEGVGLGVDKISSTRPKVSTSRLRHNSHRLHPDLRASQPGTHHVVFNGKDSERKPPLDREILLTR